MYACMLIINQECMHYTPLITPRAQMICWDPHGLHIYIFVSLSPLNILPCNHPKDILSLFYISPCNPPLAKILKEQETILSSLFRLTLPL